MAIQRLDPGGLDVASTTTTLLNAGFADDISLVGLTGGANAGRYNTHAYTTSVNNSWVGWWFTSGWQEFVFGFAYYNPNTTFTNNNRICNCQDGATTQVDIRTDGSGHLFATRNGTTIGSASSNTLTTGWHYIEMKVKVDGSVGTVEVRVDGSSSGWLSLTGQNTKATANASANRFYVISRGAVSSQLWKDIYILDTGTGVNRTFLGDISVVPLYPSGADGTYQQWAANTGTQTAAVQDGNTGTGTYPDGDTAYISDTVAGDISAFTHDACPSGTIFGVEQVAYARATTSGTINLVYVQSGSVAGTSGTKTLTTSYKYYWDIQEQNPTGSATWTKSTVDSTHIGVKVQATSNVDRVSQNLLLVAISNAVTAFNSQDLVLALIPFVAPPSKQPQFWIVT